MWVAERFLNRQTFSTRSPLILEPSKSQTIKLNVGQKIEKDEAKGLVPRVKLMLKVRNLVKAEDVEVKLNDNLLAGGKKFEDKPSKNPKNYHEWLAFRPVQNYSKRVKINFSSP